MTFKKISPFLLTVLLPFTVLAVDACPDGTTAFVCSNTAGKIKLNRCATGASCYDKTEDKEALRCCPVKETTGVTKKSLLKLAKEDNATSLEEFKQSCNYTSPLDFVKDNETREGVRASLTNAGMVMIRALIFAKSHCTDVESSEQVQRWLGNDILMSQPVRLMQALSTEKANEKMYSMSAIEKDEWFGTECQDEVCNKERKEYRAKKREVLSSAKVSKDLESIRKGLLKALPSD